MANVSPLQLLPFWLLLAVWSCCQAREFAAFDRRGDPNVRSTRHTRTPGSGLNEPTYFDYADIPRLKTFNLSDGSIVDCVPIELQLSLKHLKIRKEEIQIAPSIPRMAASLFKTDNQMPPFSEAWQLFHVEHGSCPGGSIPVHRLVPQGESAEFYSTDIFLRKYPTERRDVHIHNSSEDRASKSRTRRIEPPAADDSHQYAIVETVGNFNGAQAYLSVWDPSVASPYDFSLSQLWVGAGTQDGINTVEAGWQVYELLNGDPNPHLFIFWTADAYRSTGCYNLRCPGFVQTSPRVVLGGAISTISSPDSSIYFKKFLVYKDPSAWWLQIDGEWVGYWPATLFSALKDSAQWLQWGGEVCLSAPAGAGSGSGSTANGSSEVEVEVEGEGESVKTEMGSGYFPSDGNAKAASQCELGYMDTQMNVYSAMHLKEFSTDPNCYTAASYYDDDWGSYVVFGGNGCPPP